MSPLCFHDHLGPTLGEFFIPNELTKSHFLARYLDVPGSGWINGLDQWVISPTYKWDIIRFYIPPDPITFDPRTSRNPGHLIYHPGRCSFSRQTQEIWITRMLLPRKFLSQLVDQHCAAFKTSPFQPQGQQEDLQNTSVRPAAQKYSMASPSALPKCSRNGWWLVEFQPV